ncbi:MAG: ATP-binding protein [Planctomycetota bacterium]
MTTAQPTNPASLTLDDHLLQTLSECPPELNVCCVELRAFAAGAATSVLQQRATLPGTVVRESILDHTQLHQAMAAGGASALEDLIGDDAIQSWLLIPIGAHDRESQQQLRALVGCGIAVAAVTPEHLATVQENFAWLQEELPRAKAQCTPSRQLANAIAEAVPVPVLVTNTSGVILSANSNFALLFGSVELATESRLQTLLPEEFSTVFETALRATVSRNASVELPLPPLAEPLQGLTYTLTTALDEDGGEPAVIFVLREVSAGLQLSQLRESNDMKEFLFRTLLHDMKTPLSAIINGVELLRSMLPPGADTSCGDLLWAIDSSGNRIKLLLDDMNEYFLLRFPEDGELFRTVDLAAVIDSLLKVYRMQGLPHTFTVAIEGDGRVVGDEYRINRAIDNVLSNAVKYAPGGEVAVRVDAPDDSGFVRIEIADEGPGISAEFLGKIWDPFYRLRTAENDGIEGSGLGLSITRHIIEGQGGTIEAYSADQEGTTFVLKLQHARQAEDNADQALQ